MTEIVRPLLIFICLFINTIAEPSISNFQECSPKEIVISHGKCSLYVNELIFLSEEYNKEDVPMEAVNNMSRACQSITSCFGGLQCLESQKNKELYQRKCDSVQLKNFEVESCLTRFIKDIYEKNSSCSSKYDFTAKTFQQKREAYTSGKSCFLDFVKNNCSERALSYMKSDYDHFLDILTIPSENGTCTPVQNTLTKIQCEAVMREMQFKMIELSLSRDEHVNQNLSAACQEVADCTRPCSSMDSEGIDKLCGNFELLDDKEFVNCTEKIGTIHKENKEKLSGYKCMSGLDSIKTLTKNKDCMKEVMKGECDESALKNFDRNWKILDNALSH
ncbi:hypothetical protein GCK72_020234 [Caenorhabditis remanei]|uniref:T20D4.11-like domain-containing protein n=1 Tax=Caenorhabditis remanei TaxID=31234 RepID=A0A6A5GEK4_CAERE|nr:hypothetical protein GCK72_020234 [Caenorhabditis remanei]KAF1753677.1 hypothetical protein GCK72_020234 [Caenorhabditis remanei]